MADTQINPLATSSAPSTWTLPDALTVTLGALHATYDGTGAAGNFVPTVKIVSDSGHTVMTVVQDTTVTAGQTADASWAPFLRTATSTAPTTGTNKALHLFTNTGTVVAANSATTLSFDVVSSFDSTVYATHTTGGRVDQVNLKKQGVYAITGIMDWVSYTGLVKTIMWNLSQFSYAISFYGESTVYANVGVQDPYPKVSYTITVPDVSSFGDTLPLDLQFWVLQDSAGNRTVNFVYWDFQYLGGTDF